MRPGSRGAGAVARCTPLNFFGESGRRIRSIRLEHLDTMAADMTAPDWLCASTYRRGAWGGPLPRRQGGHESRSRAALTLTPTSPSRGNTRWNISATTGTARRLRLPCAKCAAAQNSIHGVGTFKARSPPRNTLEQSVQGDRASTSINTDAGRECHAPRGLTPPYVAPTAGRTNRTHHDTSPNH
jgi:hypothetical protein